MIAIGAGAVISNIINYVKEVARGNIPQDNRLYYLPDWSYNHELTSPRDYTSLLNAYKSWVYVCASKNASTVASYSLKLYVAKSSRNSKLLVETRPISKEVRKFLYSKEMGHLDRYLKKAVEVEEVLEHPFLDMMRNVNPFMNEFELKEMTDLHQELTGNSYWYILKNRAGIPVQVWIVQPDKISVVPSKEEFIKGYLYKRGIDETFFDKLEMIHFKFPSPTSVYYGMGCLAAVTYAYDINVNMNKYETNLFANMARPEGVLETDNELNPNEFKRVKRGWGQGFSGVKNAGKTPILEKGLKYKPITLSPRELSYLMGRKVTKEEIFNAFGLPLGLFSEESNRANSEMATYNYMKDTVSPRHRRMEEKMNENLLPMFDERLFVAFENCIPEDKEFRQKVKSEDIKDGVITRNEARLEEGRDEIKGLDDIYIDSRLLPIGETNEKEIEEVSRKISERVKEKLSVKN